MNKKSYSAVEIIFVIVLISILAGLALMRANPVALLQTQLQASARALVGDLRLTRSLAITHAGQYRLEIDPLSKTYRILDSSDAQVGEKRTLDEDITIGGDVVFVFESLGNASSGTGVTLSAGGDQYVISIVSATGMISFLKI
ncbi:MAG: GspH/FimT family protein [Candidatus Omnitrophota bacterium]